MRNVERNNLDEYVKDETPRFAEKKKIRIDYHIPRITYCYITTSNNFKAKKAFKNNIMSKK